MVRDKKEGGKLFPQMSLPLWSHSQCSGQSESESGLSPNKGMRTAQLKAPEELRSGIIIMLYPKAEVNFHGNEGHRRDFCSVRRIFPECFFRDESN